MNMRYAMRSEDTEQINVVQWAEWNAGKYPELKWLHHVPNGGSRNRVEAAKLKEMGVKAGVADLFLPCPKGIYCGLYIEMKYGSNRHTDKQKEFLADMAENGYFVVTCYSADDAIKAMEEYITLPIPGRTVIHADYVMREAIEFGDEHRMTIRNNGILKDGLIRGGGLE